jgi:glycosyltransferase involved in cell wall biosynthesis
MSSPEVSVVMSVFDDAAGLARSLDSILGQKDCDFEIIAVDDGSRDGSGELLDAYARKDSRLRVIHQENTGLTLALVRGCDEARGEFIARQDAGDISLPGRLAMQAALLREDASLAFVGCGFDLVGPQGEQLSDTFTEQRASQDGLRDPDGRSVPYPHHGSVMFRASAYRRAGGYRREFYFAQDVDLWTRLAEQGSWGYASQVLYEVRFELDGISARHRGAQLALRELINQARELRRQGRSEAEVLEKAAAIRPGAKGGPGTAPSKHRAAAAYFVASCLERQRDPRARAYFAEVLRHQPLHLRTWFKLVRSAALPWRRAH